MATPILLSFHVLLSESGWLQNLLDPPVIDSSKIYNIEDIEPPLITICPFIQYNNLKAHGYASHRDFLKGKYSRKIAFLVGEDHKIKHL